MKGAIEEIRDTLLMGPGPSCVPSAVYQALGRPTVGHLDPSFIAVMDEIKQQLQQVMKTSNRLTIPMSGTGSAGMETCFVNLVEHGDRVLILSNGVFGMRMQDLATRLGADVETLEFEWGTPVTVDAVEERLVGGPGYAIVAVVHAETSTGVCNPVAEIGELVRAQGALFLVDAVTSLGGMPVEVDAWHMDAVYSGTQKCLSCPPGLAPVSLSERGLMKLRNRKCKVPNWYLDLSMIADYWEGEKRAYHHTAPVNMLYGLNAALECILSEGLDAVFARHIATHEQLVSGLADMGLEMLVPEPCRLPMLNAVVIPDSVNDAAIRATLLKDHAIEIGAGLGPLAGKIWRIGLMGHTARPENVETLLTELSSALGVGSSLSKRS